MMSSGYILFKIIIYKKADLFTSDYTINNNIIQSGNIYQSKLYRN